MNKICGSGSVIPRTTPSPALDARDITKAGIKVLSNISSKTAVNGACLSAINRSVISMGTAIGEFYVIYRVAKDVFDNSSVCGHEWLTVNPQKFTRTASGYKQTVQNEIDKRLRERNYDLLNLETGDKIYREWYYGGVEVEDNPSSGDACLDVTQPKNSTGEYPRQKYYLKGTEVGNYNCRKYLVTPGMNDPSTNLPYTETRANEMNSAYRCCIDRSSTSVCIKYDSPTQLEKEVFCRAGSKCTISNITFAAKVSNDNRYVCAETYSLCPYNFTLSGGTQECDYYRDGIWSDDESKWVMITQEDISPANGGSPTCATKSEIRNADCTYNEMAGKCRNYCQYMTHCTRVSATPFEYKSELTSPYFSDACLNFKGDSQNTISFGDLLIDDQKHFSAPIAQCVKETMENVFYGRAGHSKCRNYGEYPSADGSCPSGLYGGTSSFIYKKGNQVNAKSFFGRMQEVMQDLVRLVLTLSVMFFGMNMLIQKKGFDLREKKDMLVYLFKIVTILYFATGDAWQQQFFNGVYNSSSEFARMVFKIETQQAPSKRDGCQFGSVTTPDGITTPTEKSYPAGKSYLAIWDTLDCKIMRYLGFGPQDSVANIASLILAGFLTPFASVGLFFAISTMFFGICLIAATVRALHIFLSSCIAIIIMVFVSPIIFPTLLFEKTKGMFDKWLTNLISYCLQPMILFAYIAIFITVLDQTVIGDATFAGAGPFKTISCSKYCQNSFGEIVPFGPDGNPPACDKNNEEMINPLDNSVACLINAKDFGTFPGFELVGLTIPIMVNLFSENARERVLTILKGTLVMFLLYKFMDEIPGITGKLIGGGLSGGTSGLGQNPVRNFMKVGKFLSNARKRAMGASKKIVSSLGNKGKSIARTIGDKGKSEQKNLTSGANADNAGSQSGGGGADSAGSQGGSEGSGADSAGSQDGGEDGGGGSDNAASS